MRTLSFSVLVLSLTAFAALTARADQEGDFLKQLVSEFNAEARGLREGHPLLFLNYVESSGERYSYHVSARFVRLAKEAKQFRIRKLLRKKEWVELELELSSNERSRLKLYFYDNAKLSGHFLMEVFPLMLRDLFAFREPLLEYRFTGNARSRNLHLTACNHLPEASAREQFKSIDSATGAGYRPCPACFPDADALPLPAYAQARREAIEAARLREIIYPPVEDEAVQRRVQELGEQILEAYPFDLKGFNYVFKVLRSDIPNAEAFPTGFVFVTDTVYHSAESDAELAFVIAHEIAHVEMDLLGEVDLSGVVDQAGALARFEYRRRREAAADWAAAWSISEVYGFDVAFAGAQSALLKLGFAAGENQKYESGQWDTHPSVGERLRALDIRNMRFVEDRIRFCGVNENGDPLLEVVPLAIGLDRGRSFAVLLIEPSDLMNGSFWVRGRTRAARLWDATDTEFSAGMPEDRQLFPSVPDIFEINLLPGGNANFHEDEECFAKFDPARFARIELRHVPDVKDWLVCTD